FTGALVTSTSNLFAASTRDSTMYGNAYVSTPSPKFSALFTPVATTAAIVGMPIFDSAATILFSTTDKKLHRMTTGGADSVFSTLPTSGGTPLLGHDAITYVGRSGGISAVDATGTVTWSFITPATVMVLMLMAA